METQNVSWSASLLEISACFIPFVSSVMLNDSIRNVSHTGDSNKNLLYNFNGIFKFWTVISEWLKWILTSFTAPVLEQLTGVY